MRGAHSNRHISWKQLCSKPRSKIVASAKIFPPHLPHSIATSPPPHLSPTLNLSSTPPLPHSVPLPHPTLPLLHSTSLPTYSECVGSQDPYCVWNNEELKCVQTSLTASGGGSGTVDDSLWAVLRYIIIQHWDNIVTSIWEVQCIYTEEVLHVL